MATLQVARVTATTPPSLRVAHLLASGTPAAARKLRVSHVLGSGTALTRLHSIQDTPAAEPGRLLTQQASLSQAGSGTPTWAWVQLSGPTVELLGADTDTVAFYTPDVMPGDETIIVLGVTATVDGVASDQVTASFEVLPQLSWTGTPGAMVGAPPEWPGLG